MGKMTSDVFFLPIYGHRHRKEELNYILTNYWLSLANNFIYGIILVLISAHSKN